MEENHYLNSNGGFPFLFHLSDSVSGWETTDDYYYLNNNEGPPFFLDSNGEPPFLFK